MANLISIPVFVVLAVLQTTIVSRLPLLHGTADLALLVLVAWSVQERVSEAFFWALIAGLAVGLVTAVPFPTLLVAYLAAYVVARLLRRQVWQIPILAMLVATFAGTLFVQGLSVLVLQFFGSPISWGQSLTLVTVPSLLLNLLLAFPVYAVVADLASWVYPVDIEL